MFNIIDDRQKYFRLAFGIKSLAKTVLSMELSIWLGIRLGANYKTSSRDRISYFCPKLGANC